MVTLYSSSESFGTTSLATPMNDTVLSNGAITNSGTQIQAEYASSTSSLVGKSIDTIVVDLKKTGSPIGTVQVGTFNSDLSVKQLFGTKDVSSLSTSFTQYSFSLTNQTYNIQSGDRIGIKFTGGDSSNYVYIGIDQTNSFDGIKSYLTYFTNSWHTYKGKDLTMTLKTNAFTIPSAPTGLSATATSSSQISLSWTAPANNGGSPIIGYKIERESPVGAGFTVLVPNTGSTATTYADTNLAANTAYNYRVSAINSVGTGPVSNSASATTTQIGLDKFGIKEIYPTISTGKEWFSKWDDGIARTFGYSTDPLDPWFDAAHGDATYSVDGKGIFNMSGSTPRMYIHDPTLNVTNSWRNVEMTVYAMRIADAGVAYGGIEGVARSNHGTTGPELSNLCDTRGIAARMGYDGHIVLVKETSHPNAVSINDKPFFSASGGGYTLPYNVWIGFKYVVYDMADGNVKLELWYDPTNGLNGGNWTKINELIDTGSNFGINGTSCASGISPTLKLTNDDNRPGSESGKPNITVYWRSDGVATNGESYKKMSVREIASQG